MYLHVVMMAFDDSADAAFFATVRHYGERIRAECEGVLGYTLTENEADRSGGHTHALVSQFVSAAAHDAYQISPVHQEMKAWMGPKIRQIVVFDGSVNA